MPVSADAVQLSIVRETGSPPATPASPLWQPLRITGEGVTFTPETTTSGELSPNLGIKDSILTGASSTGEISFEVSDNPGLQEIMEAVLGSPWTADEIFDSTELNYYTLEKIFPDIPAPGSDSYHRFVNSIFTTLSLAIAPGEPISGTSNVNGGELFLDTAEIPTSTYLSAGQDNVLVPHDVVVVMSGWAATSCFSALNLTFDNQARGIQCIGSLGTKEQIRGRMNATISGDLYYSNDAPLQELIDQSEFPVVVQLLNNLGQFEYEFNYPRCKFTEFPVVASGTDSDVVASFSIQALFDENAGHTVLITRQANVLPPLLTITIPGGDLITPAVISFTDTTSIWLAGTTIDINLDTDTTPGQTFQYILPSDASSTTVATDVAAAITAAPPVDFTVVANGSDVEFLAVVPASTITITSATAV